MIFHLHHPSTNKKATASRRKNLFYITQFVLILFLFSGESCKKQSEEPVSKEKYEEKVDDKNIIVPKDYVSRNLIEFQINFLKALKKRKWTDLKQYIFGEGIIDSCLFRKEKISLKAVFDKLKIERIKITNKNKDCNGKKIPDFYKKHHCSVSDYCKKLDFYLNINKDTYKLQLKKLIKLRGKWWVTGKFELSRVN